MKKIKRFNSQTEALMAKAYLESHAIASQVLGSKEYTTHVLGGDFGRYDLLVDENDFEQADDLLKRTEGPKEISSPPAEPDHFRRAVFHAFAAPVILPIVFNYFSLASTYRFWQSSPKDTLSLLKAAFLVILQIPTIFIIIYMTGFLRDILSHTLP